MHSYRDSTFLNRCPIFSSMKRIYKRTPLFNLKQLGTLAFAAFVVYVAFRILTPPSEELMHLRSPDGTKTARLRRYFYFDGQPSYKIYYREDEKFAWLGLYHLPAYTNIPPESAEPAIAWTDDSRRLDFFMNGTSIWHHVFEAR